MQFSTVIRAFSLLVILHKVIAAPHGLASSLSNTTVPVPTGEGSGAAAPSAPSAPVALSWHKFSNATAMTNSTALGGVHSWPRKRQEQEQEEEEKKHQIRRRNDDPINWEGCPQCYYDCVMEHPAGHTFDVRDMARHEFCDIKWI